MREEKGLEDQRTFSSSKRLARLRVKMEAKGWKRQRRKEWKPAKTRDELLLMLTLLSSSSNIFESQRGKKDKVPSYENEDETEEQEEEEKGSNQICRFLFANERAFLSSSSLRHRRRLSA